MGSVVFAPKVRTGVVAAVAVATLGTGWLSIATFLGQSLLTDQGGPIRLFWIGGTGLIALGGLAMLILLAMGLPRVEVGAGVVSVNGGIWRRSVHLARHGRAFGGFDSAGGQEQAMIYFFTLEHESALMQTGQFEPPSQHRFDAKLPVGGVVGSDRDRLEKLVEAINGARTGISPPLAMSDEAARSLAEKALRPRMWTVVAAAALAAFGLGFELFSGVDATAPGVLLVLLTVSILTGAIAWGVAVRHPYFRPFAAFNELIGGQLWLVSLALMLSLAAYTWLTSG